MKIHPYYLHRKRMTVADKLQEEFFEAQLIIMQTLGLIIAPEVQDKTISTQQP